MGLSINTEAAGLFAQRQTNRSTGLLNRALQQLSTGQRINRAADDAAGLAIAERFQTQIRQGQVESNNLQSGLSALQTAEGGLQSQLDATQRLEELALQASSGLLTEGQRASINAEAQELIQEIDAIGANTQFNGTQLLDQDQTISLGTEGGSSVELSASTATSLGVDSIDLSTAEGAQAALGAIGDARSQITESLSNIGAQSNRIESSLSVRETNTVNAQESESRIRDADIAQALLARTRNQLLQQSGISGILQGNVAAQNAVNLLG